MKHQLILTPIVFGILCALPNVSLAQMDDRLVDEVTYNEETAEMVEEMERIETLTAFGPHSKNPFAAGRVLTINRMNAVRPLPATEPIPVGPAYKNRALDLNPDVRQSAAKPRLMGPRYKNKQAKTWSPAN